MKLPDHPGGPELSRRALLRGGVLLAGTAALGAGPAGTAHAGSYSRIGTGGYAVPTTLRTGFTPWGGGSIGTHSGERAFAYDDWFHLLCDAWLETYHSILRWQTAGAVGVWFVGCAGVTVNKPGSNHQTGNAFDVTAVYHSDGGFVDCNYSHLPGAGVAANRRYAALAWSGRKHLAEVGIVGTGAAHANHVHLGRFKNGSAALPLSHWGRSWAPGWCSTAAGRSSASRSRSTATGATRPRATSGSCCAASGWAGATRSARWPTCSSWPTC